MLCAGQILTPVQDARLLVDAFPQPPDPLLLSRLVAEELRDPSAQFALEGVPSSGPGQLRPLLAPALDSTEFPPLPGALLAASTPAFTFQAKLGQCHCLRISGIS